MPVLMQHALALDGYHPGPLFAPASKRAAPMRPPGSTTMPGILRRARERRQTPAWADRHDIADLQRLARVLTRCTGIVWSVDHIIPLAHPLVCGLHIATNMRVIPLEANLRKGTRWGVEQLPLI